jgi:hypothetical protein
MATLLGHRLDAAFNELRKDGAKPGLVLCGPRFWDGLLIELCGSTKTRGGVPYAALRWKGVPLKKLPKWSGDGFEVLPV